MTDHTPAGDFTNIDRTAEIIADAFRPALLGANGIGHDIARLLNDAGLLMPDLPPVTLDDFDRQSVTVGPASPEGARDTRTGRVLLEQDGRIFTTGVPAPYRSIDQARAHALAILSMCNHAEGEHDD